MGCDRPRSTQRRLALGALALGSCLFVGANQALAQPGGFYASAGAGYSSFHANAKGALQGSLAESTAFDVSTTFEGPTLTLAGGYTYPFASGFFVEAETNVDVTSLNGNSIAPVTATGSATQIVDTCFPPPPGTPPGTPCVSFGSTTRTFSESQTLNGDFDARFAGAITARFGFASDTTRLWIGGGVSAAEIEFSYRLPVLSTIEPPQPFVIVGLPPFLSGPPPTVPVTFPAESSSPSEILVGWVVSAGIEHALSDRLTVAISYAYSDYGHDEFDNGARVTSLEVDATSGITRLSLVMRL